MEDILDYRAAATATVYSPNIFRERKRSELEPWLRDRHVASLRSPDQEDATPTEERPVDATPDAGGSR